MKKRLLCILLTVCVLCGACPVNAAVSFRDIPDPDTALAAGVLQSMGIVGGVSEGIYSPDTRLTRAQFCVLMVHTLGLKDQVNTYTQKTLFTDVKPGNWYTGYVNLAYSQGLLAGYGDGRFGPDDPVTYGQAATLLLRILNYTSADVGKVWPTDYVNFAASLELDDGVRLSAGDHVTRGQAAILLYNTLNTHAKGGASKFYNTFGDTAAVKNVIILDTDACNGTASGLLMACVIGPGGVSTQYFAQKNILSDALIGCEGDLLVNSADKVVGFMPSSTLTRDVVISSAKASGITGTDGSVHKIPGATSTIVGDEIFAWSSTGHIRANGLQGSLARLYYDEDGSITYVHISSGKAKTAQQVAVARSDTPAAELAASLGVSGPYSISKNGMAAQANDLAAYDTAYFDKATGTLRTSDHRLTGYIESASPALDGAQTITVAGCTVNVLEAAWDSLSGFRPGDRVTLLLTDDCQVAAAVSPSAAAASMVGVLSADRRSVTLAGSGLTVTSGEISADISLAGTLVKVYPTQDDRFICSAYTSPAPGDLDLARRTLGGYELAPSCHIYEAVNGSYVCSLSGDVGQSSTDFEALFWTDTIHSDDIKAFRLNCAGKVDLLLLEDVTGNCYDYGRLKRYTDSEGIMTATSPRPIFSSAATLTNARGTGQKLLCSLLTSVSSRFYGIATGRHSDSYQRVTALLPLSSLSDLDGGSFFLHGDDWYASANGHDFPVSDRVQVYIATSDRWLSGENAISSAISAGLPLNIYYDRTASTGAQVRVIVAGDLL